MAPPVRGFLRSHQMVFDCVVCAQFVLSCFSARYYCLHGGCLCCRCKRVWMRFEVRVRERPALRS